MTAKAPTRRILLLAAGSLLTVAACSLLGFGGFSPDDFAARDGFSPYWDIRLPRTILAALVGAALAVGGVIFQAIFRNPLATPYTLGVDAGAALGAAVGIALNLGTSWLGLPRLGGLALLGAAGATTAVALIARAQKTRDMTRLLLAGVCVAYLSTAGIVLVTILARRGSVSNDVLIWLLGSLEVFDPRARLHAAIALVGVLLFAVWSHRALDLIALGEDVAASRGVAVDATLWGSFALVSAMTAILVAHCGPIGFVGLIVPHFARLILGARALPQLVGSALLGAAFLAACDALARSLSIYETPVGVVTNIFGAGFFFYLLLSRGGR